MVTVNPNDLSAEGGGKPPRRQTTRWLLTAGVLAFNAWITGLVALYLFWSLPPSVSPWLIAFMPLGLIVYAIWILTGDRWGLDDSPSDPPSS